MAYMSAASLNLTDSYVEPLEFGEVVISAEFSTIPKLNSEQQKIGFGGLKYEILINHLFLDEVNLKWVFTGILYLNSR